MIDTEIWKLSNEYWKVSTDKKRLKNRLEKLLETKPGDVYLQKGNEVAWAFTFEKEKLNEVRKEIRQIEKESKKLKDARNKRTTKKN